MDGDGPGHGCRCAVLAAPGEVASLPAVVLLLHQVVAGAEGNEMGVVRRSRNGDAACAADVSVAQLVRQLLQLVRVEVIVVPQHVVVAGSARALDPLVAAQVEVELGGVGDPDVHRRACRNVSALPTLLLLVRAEEPGVVTLLHHDEGDAGLVVRLQLDASLADGSQLVLREF